MGAVDGGLALEHPNAEASQDDDALSVMPPVSELSSGRRSAGAPPRQINTSLASSVSFMTPSDCCEQLRFVGLKVESWVGDLLIGRGLGWAIRAKLYWLVM